MPIPAPCPARPQLHPDASNLNISHTIHALRFGPAFPGQARPPPPAALPASCRALFCWLPPVDRAAGAAAAAPAAATAAAVQALTGPSIRPPLPPTPRCSCRILQANPLQGAVHLDRKSTGVDKYFLKVASRNC